MDKTIKLFILFLFINTVNAQIISEQNICLNDYLLQNVVFKYGDEITWCNDCIVYLKVYEKDTGLLILPDTQIYELTTGIFKYQITTNNFKLGKYYKAYHNISSPTQGTGIIVSDFYVKDCSENDDKDNGLLDKYLDNINIGLDLSWLKDKFDNLINVIKTLAPNLTILTGIYDMLNKSIFANALRSIISFFGFILFGIARFLISPYEFLVTYFIPSLIRIFMGFILFNVIIFVVIEIGIIGLSVLKGNNEFFTVINNIFTIHYNILIFLINMITYIVDILFKILDIIFIPIKLLK